MPVIKVFEHSKLEVGELFKDFHYKQLIKYNEASGNKYFKIGYNKIIFKQYVGVIQVGNLIIEILPKADKNQGQYVDEINKWHRVLISMLKISGYININFLDTADLAIYKSSIFDLFHQLFINEVKELLHKGLRRSYRFQESNRPYLKGKLIFNKHISENYLHKEKFYTSAQVYDFNNILNQIILKALKVIKTSSYSKYYNVVKDLIYSFEDVDDVYINEKTFSKLKFTRNNSKYKNIVNLAKLIILNFNPDFSSGTHNVTSMLIDMNILYEKVIYQLLKRQENNYEAINLKLTSQDSKIFWGDRYIKPDIKGEYTSINHEKVSFIIDTKWKRPKNDQPQDSDLKQMFAYNILFKSHHSILLYPYCMENKSLTSNFNNQETLVSGITHFCSTYYIDIFNEDGSINMNSGSELLRILINESEISNVCL